MDPFWIEAIGVLFLIVLIGFFSACEVAVVSTRKSRMQELAEEGNRNAEIVLQFQNNPEQFLATVHVGVVSAMTLASGLAGTMGFQHLAPALQSSETIWIREGSGWISLVIMVVSIGSFVVVFGELVPKSLAMRFAEPVALRVASSLSVFAAIFRFPVKLLTTASNIFLYPFKDKTSFMESKISEEEFKLILEEGTKTGVIDKT